MKRNTKIALGVLGGAAVVGGAAWLIAGRRETVPLLPEENTSMMPDESMSIDMLTAAPIGYHRDPPPPGAIALNGGVLRATIKKPKFVISYNKDDFDSGGDLRKMFSPGDVISYSKGLKFLGAGGGGPINLTTGLKGGFVATPLAEFTSWMAAHLLTLGDMPPGFKSSYLDNISGTTELFLPAGTYVVTPNVYGYTAQSKKFLSGYWKMTKNGPRELSKDELIAKFNAGDCTKKYTKIRMSRGGSVQRSWSTVEVAQGKTKDITLQPYAVIGISRSRPSPDVKSIAFKVFCETWAFSAGYIPDWVWNLVGKLG